MSLGLKPFENLASKKYMASKQTFYLIEFFGYTVYKTQIDNVLKEHSTVDKIVMQYQVLEMISI